jgi:DNA-binding LytR/AlgR family response regulator
MPSTNEVERAVVALEPCDGHEAIAPDPRSTLSMLDALRERVSADPALLDALLQRIVEMQAARAHLRWIKAAIGRDVALIDVRSVLYFQADTKYTRVVTAEREALIRRPLKALVEELDPASFWPIHRSTIVNVAAVAGITRDERARVVVRLKSRTERLPVSVAYEHLFRQM